MTAADRSQIGLILLAAGGSIRFGTPKQLHELEGKSLLRRAAEQVEATSADPVIVVLGAEAEAVRRELEGVAVSNCVNDAWREGLSSSIRAGLKALIALEPDINGVAIVLCDLPYVSTEKIENLIRKFRQTGAPIVASRYGDTIGVPAVFAPELFAELLLLKGDKGARSLIRKYIDSVETIELKEAALDIDTPDDIMAAREAFRSDKPKNYLTDVHR